MQEVDVSRTIDAPREAVMAALSPRDIVEYAATYEVRDVERTEEGWTVTADAPDLEVVLEFTETDRGFVYRQRDGQGPFAKMYASVSVAEDQPVVVTARSCFTFGTRLSRIMDWIASRERRMELNRLLAGVAAAVEDESDEPAADA